MNKKKNRIAGVIITIAVISGMCAGCGADAAQTPEKTETVTESEAAEETATDLEEENLPETEEGEDDLKEVLSDPTLGGIFQLYTAEEYEEVVENVKKYADGGDVSNMETALEKLKADNGKGEFVLYKSVFNETYEEDGYQVVSGFNPMIVMNPWQEYEDAKVELTAEAYQKEIASVTNTLDQAISRGLLTREQKEIILAKMDDNLSRLQ